MSVLDARVLNKIKRLIGEYRDLVAVSDAKSERFERLLMEVDTLFRSARSSPMRFRSNTKTTAVQMPPAPMPEPNRPVPSTVHAVPSAAAPTVPRLGGPQLTSSLLRGRSPSPTMRRTPSVPLFHSNAATDWQAPDLRPGIPEVPPPLSELQALRDRVMAPLTARIARSIRPLSIRPSRYADARHTSPTRVASASEHDQVESVQPSHSQSHTMIPPAQIDSPLLTAAAPAPIKLLSPHAVSRSSFQQPVVHNNDREVSAPAAAAFDSAFAHLNENETRALQAEIEALEHDGGQGLGNSGVLARLVDVYRAALSDEPEPSAAWSPVDDVFEGYEPPLDDEPAVDLEPVHTMHDAGGAAGIGNETELRNEDFELGDEDDFINDALNQSINIPHRLPDVNRDDEPEEQEQHDMRPVSSTATLTPLFSAKHLPHLPGWSNLSSTPSLRTLQRAGSGISIFSDASTASSGSALSAVSASDLLAAYSQAQRAEVELQYAQRQLDMASADNEDSLISAQETYDIALSDQMRARAQVQSMLQTQRDALIQQRLQLHYLQEQARRTHRQKTDLIRERRATSALTRSTHPLSPVAASPLTNAESTTSLDTTSSASTQANEMPYRGSVSSLSSGNAVASPVNKTAAEPARASAGSPKASSPANRSVGQFNRIRTALQRARQRLDSVASPAPRAKQVARTSHPAHGRLVPLGGLKAFVQAHSDDEVPRAYATHSQLTSPQRLHRARAAANILTPVTSPSNQQLQQQQEQPAVQPPIDVHESSAVSSADLMADFQRSGPVPFTSVPQLNQVPSDLFSVAVEPSTQAAIATPISKARTPKSSTGHKASTGKKSKPVSNQKASAEKSSSTKKKSRPNFKTLIGKLTAFVNEL